MSKVDDYHSDNVVPDNIDNENENRETRCKKNRTFLIVIT